VHLEWDQPGGTGGLLAYHTGYDANGIGTGGAVDFSCAARFTADELMDFYGMSLSEIKVVIHSADFTGVTVKVWEGGSFGDPGTEVYSADITGNVVPADWTVHTMTSPVMLTSGNEYWIGYEINASGDHPAAVDAGPMVPDKGAWMYFNGAWDLLPNLGATLDFNWCIEGAVTADGETLPLGPVAKAKSTPLKASYTDAALSAARHTAIHAWVPAAPVENTRALNGYKVYRDGAMIHEITDPNVTEYDDMALDAGTYEYYVTAVYDTGDSDPSNTATAVVALPAATGFNAVSQGPAQPNIMCTWTAPTEARDIAMYHIYQDGTEVGTSTTTFFVHIGVATGEYEYWVVVEYDGGFMSDESNHVTVNHVPANNPAVPTVTALNGNYPNPFNPTTDVKFSLNQPTRVRIDVYNIKGEMVKTLVNEELDAAYHTVTWNGDDANGRLVGSGVYFYKMRAGKYTSTKKMILMK
jgi:hypothetical protein